jgi:hypothetical protein
MADATPNNPNQENIKDPTQGSSSSVKAAKELTKQVKETLGFLIDEDQYLKSQLKSLEKQVVNFDKVAAKLASIDKTTFNTKSLEKQLQKIQEDKFLITKKIADANLQDTQNIQKYESTQTRIFQLEKEKADLIKKSGDAVSSEQLAKYDKLIEKKRLESETILESFKNADRYRIVENEIAELEKKKAVTLLKIKDANKDSSKEFAQNKKLLDQKKLEAEALDDGIKSGERWKIMQSELVDLQKQRSTLLSNGKNGEFIDEKELKKYDELIAKKKLEAEDTLKNLKFGEQYKTLQEEISELQNNLTGITNRRASNNQEVKQYDELIAKKHLESEAIKETLSSRDLEMALLLQEEELRKKIEQATLEQIATEKQLKRDVGLTGGVVMKLAKNFGIGEQAAEAMVEKARKLNEEGKKISFGDKVIVLAKTAKDAIKKGWEDPIGRATIVAGALSLAFKGIGKVGNLAGGAISSAGKAMGGLSENSTGVVTNLTSGFSGMLKTIPLVGGLIGGIVDGLSGVADLLLGANDQIIKAGRNLGLSRGEAEKMANHFQDVSFRNNDIYVTSKKLMDTQVSLGAQLGINNQLTDEQLSTLTKLKDIAGIDEQTQASIAESSTITGKTAKETTQAVLAQVVGLQKATGISLNQKQILKEASSLGGYLGLSFAKYPGQLSKALVTAKSFGLELKQLDSIADSFLDFESSISNEFEAQLLTGKDINLTKAREAFLNNDLATAAGEISSQVGSSADFMKMNRIQAESLAKAMGMSRDQLGDMLKKQEILAKIGAKETDSSAKQFELAKKKYATQKEFNAALGDEAFQNMQNASTQEKIAAYMDKLKTSIVDFVERSHLIDKIESFIDYLSNPQNMQGVLNTIKGVIASAIEFFGGVASNVATLISHMPFTDTEKWQNIADKIDSGTAKAASAVRGVGGDTSVGDMGSVSDRTARAAALAGISNLPSNITKEAQNVDKSINFKIEQKYGNKPGEMLYRIINEDGGAVLYDWQSGVYGLTK